MNQQADDSFTEYISAYSTGKLSSRSPITVQLADTVSAHKRNAVAPTRLFSFEPAIRGKATWITGRLIEFVPDQALESGQEYRAKLNLAPLLEVEQGKKTFSFGFQVIKQNYDVEIEGLVYVEGSLQIKGQFITADFSDTIQVAKAINFDQSGTDLTVDWKFDLSGGRKHQFVVSGVKRRKDASEVSFKVDGRGMGVSWNFQGSVAVPARNDFEVLDTKVVRQGVPYVLVRFSDPLKEGQNLNGLITIGNQQNLRFDVYGNEVKVYISQITGRPEALNVSSTIRNSQDVTMKENFGRMISFAQNKPLVSLVGKGTILPNTNGLIFPFEAISLTAVDVTVVKVFEKNIFQFLQVNSIDGNLELRRVSKPVAKRRVELDELALLDLSKWNRFHLDLSEMMETEPGAIYQVRLSYRKSYSLFGCPENDEPEETNINGGIPEDDWNAYDAAGAYDSYDGSYYPPGYRWEDRDNPCTDSYYSRSRMVRRNVMSSDLGVIAKIGNNRKLNAYITDLTSTEPLSGVTVEVYDYQQELLETITTDNQGMAEIDLLRKPYLLVAKRGTEHGYLKLDDGSSLSMSNFNVGGARVKRGLKGFIYGERGVWRPGDDIHLDFILEDKDQNLPADHPVVFELLDPSGAVKDRMVRNSSMDGFYSFPTKTKEADPTGNWRARVTVGGTTFTKRIKVETVKPNRLRIDLDFDQERIYAGTGSVSGDLNVQWLTGATARNLKAEFDMFLTPTTTRFEDYPNYSFDDKAKRFYTETSRVFESRVDNNGFARVIVGLGKQTEAPGALRAVFSGKVYEPGGDFSIDQFSIPFYPFTHFVGVKKPEGDRRGQLLTDKNHTMQIVSVDAQGNPVSRSDLSFEVYKIDWRWWWDQSVDNIANYVGRNYQTPYLRQTVRTINGKASVRVKIPDRDWGRYYIRVIDKNSGHSAGSVVYFDWPGWTQDANRPGGASLLAFSTDKEDYNLGETAKVQIPGTANGRALVSIENGSKVVASYWVKTQAGPTEFEFELTEDMVPNAYVHTTLVQPHAQTVNDLPIRLYGVVPINVSDPMTKLAPQILTAEVFEPESEVEIQVREQNGRAMTYTVAVVDEGLLDITRFNTPKPWNTFYARQALGVKTWDLYDDVSGALNRDLTRLLAIGGDGTGTKPEKSKANRFKPVVKHLGPFKLEPGETASHKFDMPNYVGSVRTMVVAGREGAYGSTEKATPVRRPLMVLGTLPRVIGPGEKVKLPVNVFVLDEKIKDVKVTVEGNALLQNTGASTARMRFDGAGDQIIDFDFEVSDNLGVGKVQIVAESGSEKATFEVEIQVRTPNPEMTDVEAVMLEAGESWNQGFRQVGMAGTNEARLELSVIPPINLSNRLKYLMHYPHGCIEQTTSSVFPQLFLTDIMSLSPDRIADIERNVKAGIDRISSFQTDEGGFAYWPSQSDDNDWGTNYAGHFLLEARDKGYAIPSQMINDWKAYQSRRARDWTRADQYNDDLVQAYRLYTLAKMGTPETGAMNRLREDSRLSVDAKWRLAAAYALTGRISVAQDLAGQLPTETTRKTQYHYYGSVVRDNAMILETLSLMDMRKEGLTLLRQIADQLSENHWMSTQTTAYALLAVIKFTGVDNQSTGLEADFSLNGGTTENLITAKPVKEVIIPVTGTQDGQVSLTNKSDGVLFVRLIKSGVPLAGEETSSASGMRLKVVYTDRNSTVIQPDRLSQGTDFFAEVTVYNTGTRGTYRDLALSQIFPSGWEILNERLNDLPGTTNTHNYDHKDIRDDRVYTYFNLRPNTNKTFKVALNATYSGRYYLPGVNVEAMYDHTINARESGKWVEVLRED